MRWIDRFARGSFGLFAGNVLEGFQPIDFYHFFPLWYDLWIARIAEALRRIHAEDKGFRELRPLLPTPSNLRALIVKCIPTVQGFAPSRRRAIRQDLRTVTNFFARMLAESCPKDPFAEKANPFRTGAEVRASMRRIRFRRVTPEQARTIGQLITAAGSYVHGVYNDVVTDYGWDAYGPYSVRHHGQSRVLLIRHFPDLAPKELWAARFLVPVHELIIYPLYEGVRWEIRSVGCHTVVRRGNPTLGMRKVAVIADGRYVTAAGVVKLTSAFSLKAEALYRAIRAMGFERLKQQVLLQECYQLKKLFDAAGMDWHPTPAMRARIKGRPLLRGILPHGIMMRDLAMYRKVFGIDQFTREVLGEHQKKRTV